MQPSGTLQNTLSIWKQFDAQIHLWKHWPVFLCKCTCACKWGQNLSWKTQTQPTLLPSFSKNICSISWDSLLWLKANSTLLVSEYRNSKPLQYREQMCIVYSLTLHLVIKLKVHFTDKERGLHCYKSRGTSYRSIQSVHGCLYNCVCLKLIFLSYIKRLLDSVAFTWMSFINGMWW